MPRLPIGERPLAFIDTETTGLDPSIHEIIEFAIIREDTEGFVEEWSTQIRPTHIETADPEALRINGYNTEAWAHAPTFDLAAEFISRMLDGCVLVGHNIAFDALFLTEEFKRTDIEFWRPKHKIDTVTLVYEHLIPCGLQGIALDKVRAFLGLSLTGSHTALQDARDCRLIYHKLSRASRLDRLRWKVRGKLFQ